ncbi:hypothetical protein Fcan01_10538 [Folsomia candida]|uniref:Uncharacterized protein n=1 Tax=Folsomia candida TaxID=158441 RepID=A0A226EAS1_FOLCA|nr:hypothetical protein Fcan01_10538 [Folsomia candida]
MENGNKGHELAPCVIKFSVKVDQFSERLSPSVQKGVKSCQVSKLEKEFSFFIPPTFQRINQDAISQDSQEVASLKEELEEWVSDYYGSFIKPAYGEYVVNHAVSYVLRLCPTYPVHSAKFRVLSHCFILSTIFDDWLDDTREKSGFSDDNDKNSGKEITKFVKAANPNLSSGKFKKSLRIEFVRCFESLGWTFVNSREGGLDEYCVDTFRYFRTLEAGLPIYMTVIKMIENIELPEFIRINPVFTRWHEMADKVKRAEIQINSFPKPTVSRFWQVFHISCITKQEMEEMQGAKWSKKYAPSGDALYEL